MYGVCCNYNTVSILDACLPQCQGREFHMLRRTRHAFYLTKIK